MYDFSGNKINGSFGTQKKADKSSVDFFSKLKIPKESSEGSKTTGSIIKNNIKGVLSKKYGELDTRNLFDGIDDREIEKNIPTAENADKADASTKANPKMGLRFMAGVSAKTDKQNETNVSNNADKSNAANTSKYDRFSITTKDGIEIVPKHPVVFLKEYFSSPYNVANGAADLFFDNDMLNQVHKYLTDGIKKLERPNNIGKGLWDKQIADDLKWVDEVFGPASKLSKFLKVVPIIPIAVDTGVSVVNNVTDDAGVEETITDALLEIVFGATEEGVSALATAGAGSISDGILAIPADFFCRNRF